MSIFKLISFILVQCPSALPILSRVSQPATPGSHPHVVQLLGTKYNRTNDQLLPQFFGCGGFIVSPNIVVTAAHCVTTPENETELIFKIIAGESQWNAVVGKGQVRVAKEVIIYPEFIKVATAGGILVHDAALLILNYPLAFNQWVQPILIQIQESEPAAGSTVKFYGWGYTESNRSSSSEHLLEASVQIVDRGQCQREVMEAYECRSESDCASFAPEVAKMLLNPKEEDDFFVDICVKSHSLCYGDSGGALICLDSNNKSYACGIASWISHDGCEGSLPIGFTAVKDMLSYWIQDNISDYNFTCRPSEFNCGNGECVPASAHCDRAVDCRLGTDEINCGPCGPNQFQCTSTTHTKCVDVEYICDGWNNCPDASDELSCEECRIGQFWCGNRTEEWECIDSALVCNGVNDCGGVEAYDELGCGECTAFEFRCSSGKCVRSESACDGDATCGDGAAEEMGCGNFTRSGATALNKTNQINCERHLDLRTCRIRSCSFNHVTKECWGDESFFYFGQDEIVKEEPTASWSDGYVVLFCITSAIVSNVILLLAMLLVKRCRCVRGIRRVNPDPDIPMQ